MTFFVAVGIIAASVLQPLWSVSNSKRTTSRRYEDDAEFFVDEDF